MEAASINGRYTIVTIVSKRMFPFCSKASLPSATDDAEKSWARCGQLVHVPKMFMRISWHTPSRRLCIPCLLRSMRSRNSSNRFWILSNMPFTVSNSSNEESANLIEIKILGIERSVPSMCSAHRRRDWRAQKYLLELLKFRSSNKMFCRSSLSKVMELGSVICSSSESKTSSHVHTMWRRLFLIQADAEGRSVLSSKSFRYPDKGLRVTIKEGAPDSRPPLHETLNFCSRIYFSPFASTPKIPLGERGAWSEAGGLSVKLK